MEKESKVAKTTGSEFPVTKSLRMFQPSMLVMFVRKAEEGTHASVRGWTK